MKFLYENGYQTVNLKEAICYLSGVKKLKEKTVVITFDDGFRDLYTEAFPVLNSYGFSATVFLPTAFIKNKRLKFKEKECLSWDEIRKLQGKGIIFGSHTINHPVLYKMTMNDIEYEL
ncbi:MAG: polysaccharide deacetylase family protein, partial [Deltaproteobacteria bacterium]|nr:polysaccharide deacetylase family protein [Deltaproteobacteria bacterium]